MEREMTEEMTAHVAQATERFAARGMSPRDAAIAARREFGPAGTIEEQARDARGGNGLDSFGTDIKYAFRYFRRTPLTTITIILTLALGIGFSSAVFSVITGILTRPAPGVPNDPALVKIRGISNERPFGRRLTHPELMAYAGLSETFESVAAWVPTGVVVDGGDINAGALTVRASFVTPNYFRVIGTPLAAGRSFGQSRFHERYPAEPTAVISESLARERFGSPAAALGKQMQLNDVAVTIVGVAAPRFNGVIPYGVARQLWLPLSAWPLVGKVDPRIFTDSPDAVFDAFARLRPGVSPEGATQPVRAIAQRFGAEKARRAGSTAIQTADVVPLRGRRVEVTGRYENELGPTMAISLAIATLILLVCTTTVNSLLVGAALARRYEIGVRLALGASRRRVIRQLLTEIAIPALTGGALGMYGFGILARFTEVAGDGYDVSANWMTIAFTMSYALITAAICGLSPALHATRVDVSSVLKDTSAGATRKSRLQRTFVIAQIAIAQPLMIGLAAAMIHSAGQSRPAKNQALRERVLTAELDTYTSFTLGIPDPIPALTRRIAELPTVTHVVEVGPTTCCPMVEVPASTADTARRQIYTTTLDVPPEYFAAFSVPIVRGRGFVAADTFARAITPVVIDDSLAVQLFKSSDPLGRRFQRARRDNEPLSEFEVVGVAHVDRDSHVLAYAPDYPLMFSPFHHCAVGQCSNTRLLIRASSNAETLIPTTSALVRDEARMVPLNELRTLSQIDRRMKDTRASIAQLGSICGAIALLLASIGLYAMVGVGVGQRRREIGVRIALGARADQVVRMFFSGGLRAALIGLAIGLPVSIAVLVAMLRMLDVTLAYVPLTVVAVTLAVAGIASVASWLPARRASKVDPMIALRSE
jgi:putative ABC transport system permease protein